jgi:hypothetical protein
MRAKNNALKASWILACRASILKNGKNGVRHDVLNLFICQEKIMLCEPISMRLAEHQF